VKGGGGSEQELASIDWRACGFHAGIVARSGRLPAIWLPGRGHAARPAAIGVALLVLGIVTMAAGYLPARQASRIDPVRAGTRKLLLRGGLRYHSRLSC
jgi:hypothetical protein